VIVVATEEFELYHGVVGALRDRNVPFTTVDPGGAFPDGTRVVVQAPDDPVPDIDEGVERVVAPPDEPRRAVDEALAHLRGGEGRTVVGVDPGERPGIAVLAGDVVVAAFHVPLADAVATVRSEVADAADPLVRVGDGARRQGSRIVNDLDEVPVEVVDETGTTPYLGVGARGMGDVLAAVNIARLPGERVDAREVDPTAGEIQRIKDESRRRSAGDRTIDEELARRVAAGELTVEEAISAHEAREAGRRDADADGE
jgi:hypothetical protein